MFKMLLRDTSNTKIRNLEITSKHCYINREIITHLFLKQTLENDSAAPCVTLNYGTAMKLK